MNDVMCVKCRVTHVLGAPDTFVAGTGCRPDPESLRSYHRRHVTGPVPADSDKPHRCPNCWWVMTYELPGGRMPRWRTAACYYCGQRVFPRWQIFWRNHRRR